MKKLAIATLLFLALAASAWAGDIRALVQNAKPAVLHIATFDREGKVLGYGTAFFISADGYLVTNEHVVDGAHSILDRDYKGTVFHVFRSKDSWSEFSPTGSTDPDLEILRADATNVPYLKLGSTVNEVEGQRVLVIGNPMNEEFSVSDGIISSFRGNRSYIQITAPISAGSSGSPVIDCDSGEVIGIATLTRKEGQNLNLAIATEKIREVIAKTGFIAQTPPPVAKVAPTPWSPPEKDLVTPPAPSPDVAKLAGEYFQRGVREWKTRDFEGAIRDLTEALRLDPRDINAYFPRGSSHMMLRQYSEAISDFTESIRLIPDDRFSYGERALAYNNLRQYNKAISDSTKAIQLDPDNDTYYGTRAMAYLHLRQYGKAISDSTKAIQLDPSDYLNYEDRADAYDAIGDHAKAEQDLRKAKQLKGKK